MPQDPLEMMIIICFYSSYERHLYIHFIFHRLYNILFIFVLFFLLVLLQILVLFSSNAFKLQQQLTAIFMHTNIILKALSPREERFFFLYIPPFNQIRCTALIIRHRVHSTYNISHTVSPSQMASTKGYPLLIFYNLFILL